MTLSPDEIAEYERLKSIVITETPHGVLYIQQPPMTVDEWKRMMPRVNAEHLQALAENTVNTEGNDTP
tara:strand:+ start:170794 stop:170997 length:204 start_codon:yes stop_codon:yes gene_type:complete